AEATWQKLHGKDVGGLAWREVRPFVLACLRKYPLQVQSTSLSFSLKGVSPACRLCRCISVAPSRHLAIRLLRTQSPWNARARFLRGRADGWMISVGLISSTLRCRP